MDRGNLAVRWVAASERRHCRQQDAFAARARARAAGSARFHAPLLARLCVVDDAKTSGFVRECRSDDPVARGTARGESFADDRWRLWRSQRLAEQDKGLARQPGFNGVAFAADYQLLKNLESQRILSLKSGEIAILDFDRLRTASLGEDLA